LVKSRRGGFGFGLKRRGDRGTRVATIESFRSWQDQCRQPVTATVSPSTALATTTVGAERRLGKRGRTTARASTPNKARRLIPKLTHTPSGRATPRRITISARSLNPWSVSPARRMTAMISSGPRRIGRVSSGWLPVHPRFRIAFSGGDPFVGASYLDPTNLNSFEHQSDDGQVVTLRFSSQDAIDRFCFPVAGTCSASIQAPRGSAIGRLLGGRSAPVRVGFAHDRLARIDVDLSGPGAEGGDTDDQAKHHVFREHRRPHKGRRGP
jgi:hypothetical protein